MTNPDAFLDTDFNEIKCVRCDVTDLMSMQKIEDEYFCMDCLDAEISPEIVDELE